ncbi:hypothetical protein AAC387_Pa02g1486 [Persea americana]
MPVRLKDCQGGSSKKEDCVITKQDVLNKMPIIFASNSLSTLITPTSEIKDDRQNTPAKDVLVITISDMSSRSDEDCRAEFEKAPDIVTISSSDSFITETPEVITLEA